VARAEAYLHGKFHLDPSNRLATIHQGHRQTGQRTNSIGRAVLQMVAQKYCDKYCTTASLTALDSAAHGGLQSLNKANATQLNRRAVSRSVGCYRPPYHRHLLLSFSPKAGTHFTVPLRVEGCLNIDTVVSLCRLYIMYRLSPGPTLIE